MCTRFGLLVLAVVALLAGACTSDQGFETLQSSLPEGGPTTTVPIDGSTPPCDGTPGVGGTVPAGAAPGDLIAASDLAPSHGTTAGFPTDAKVWRILYVSTGVDETDLQLVCGVAAAPADGPAAVDGVGHQLAWAHGTIGLQQACLPSNHPDTTFWGPMGSGIGAVAWGSGLRKRRGEASDGALQTALDRGWVVSASDYQPNDTYVIGRVAGANVVDAARATTQLMTQEFGARDSSSRPLPESYDTITWGHSQGGHAALWAGQLLETYQAATPNPAVAPLRLRGVAAEAPAANLIAQPDLQPGVEYGDGLADREMHTTIEVLPLPIAAFELQIGPALFSYIFGSWSEYSKRGAPGADAQFPAYPAGAADLHLPTVATNQGATTIARIAPLCLGGDDAKVVQKLVSPYRDAATNQMLTDPLWNLPEAYRTGQYFRGGTDRTCATTEDPLMVDWCDWIRWNIPGPTGDNPFPKAPMSDGEHVPMLIVQGADDQVIHCISPDGAAPGDLPAAADCMSTALYDSLRSAEYCPPEGDHGRLQLSIFRKDGAASPASHLSIPGQIAARGSSRSADDLRFDGSPLDRFFAESFEGRAGTGCRAAVVNP